MSNEMHPDLEWLARNISEWRHDDCDLVRVSECKNMAIYTTSDAYQLQRDKYYTKPQWLQARKDLGIDPSGISEADEEECIQLAYERMNEESVKVSIEELQDNVNKPKHYQLREGYEVYDLRQDLAAKAANGGATYDQYSDWDRAIEYIIRMWGKNRLEDAKKGRWYLDKLIEKLEA